MKPTYFFAVDLGATSGRTILGSLGEKLELREITRFANPIIEILGHCHWDIYGLYDEIVRGLREVAREGIEIRSVGIDTWGVDVALFGRDGRLLRAPYCYRDPHTAGESARLFERVPRERVYGLTGIQVMDFNTLFQLSALRREGCSALEAADKVLFMPDALTYLLTGRMVTEETIASTSQMMDARTRRFAPELLRAVGLDEARFAPFVSPGTRAGELSAELQRLTGLGPVPVIAVAGHDTASAIAAAPAADADFAYLSSGTWSLMGVETKAPVINADSARLNFTNEGGVEGTTCLLKNICGMWLLERCRKEWEAEGGCSYAELTEAALAAPAFRSLVNPDAPCFANPASMTDALATYCRATGQPAPESRGETARCIFESLALRYRQVLGYLRELSPVEPRVLHIIGGGSRNDLLNRFTCAATGLPVVAGPAEATAIGNIMLQAKAAGLAGDVASMRRLIARSVETVRHEPGADAEAWDEGYRRYLSAYREDIR